MYAMGVDQPKYIWSENVVRRWRSGARVLSSVVRLMTTTHTTTATQLKVVLPGLAGRTGVAVDVRLRISVLLPYFSDGSGRARCASASDGVHRALAARARGTSTCGAHSTPVPTVYAAPVDECSAPAPAVHVALSSVVEFFVPSPATYAAPAPVVEFCLPAPVVYAALAPVVVYIVPTPPVIAAPALAVECIVPAPASSCVAPAPAGYVAPASVAEYIAPASA